MSPSSVKKKNSSKVMTDVTPYLSLPQKIAAVKLGITESLLSKKFKEATNRKWPYRYLKKLEREMEHTKSMEEYANLLKRKNELLAPLSLPLSK